MKVYEIIKLLEKMPQFNTVKLDDGEYVNDVDEVELDERDYVIIRPYQHLNQVIYCMRGEKIMEFSYMDLLMIISSITEDNDIYTLDELFNHLQENEDLKIVIESL